MTALKPIEDTSYLQAVPSKRYPLNRICAHPECDRTDVTAHHIFGRQPGPDGDSWFVQLPVPRDDSFGGPPNELIIIPHATGLCGSGTTGHHGDLEEHRAWIKYEEREFVWYEFEPWDGEEDQAAWMERVQWKRLGPLNPQPGSVEGKPKRRPRKKGEGPVQVYSVKAPQDDPEAVERIKEKVTQLHERFEKGKHKIGRTVTLERALDYTLMNSGPEDF